MAEPVLKSATASNFDDTATTAESVTISWLAGELIVVLGATENTTVTLALPTATGLTFQVIATRSSTDNCNVYAWYAIAAADGTSVTVSCATDGGTSGRGIVAFVYGDHDGIGNWAAVQGQAGTTLALNQGTPNSAVVFIDGDWSASVDVTVTSEPATGSTQHVANENAGRFSAFVISWTDQGAVGETAYGFTAGGSTDNSIIVVEIRGIDATLKPADRFLPARL